MDGGRSEVRWFVPGDLPADLRPTGSPRRRQDAYDVANLSPATSVKRRGPRDRVEWKVRVGRVELIEIGPLVGFLERWVKFRDEAPGESHRRERWVPVDKEVWTAGRLEVARLAVAGEPWWTVALPHGDGAAVRLLEPWTEWLVANGVPGSYPSWLLHVVASAA